MKLNELKCINSNINVDSYMNFMNEVRDKMKYPDWLGDFNKESIIELLNNNSKIWIYYLDNEPVCSMMLMMTNEKVNEIFDTNLDYKEVVDYGPMFVNPKYRGNSLQYQMFNVLDEYCKKIGYKYAICTAHPDNIYSINNILKDDFIYHKTKEYKRGIRNIYIKRLNMHIEYNITNSEFLEMIKAVGWKTYTDEQVALALKNTMYMVKVLIDDKIVGIGRVVGDYSIVCILSDICVKPDYQGLGIGTIIVNKLKQLIIDNVKDGENMQIELTPTAGKESFYENCGFKYKPDKITGMYLWIKK